MYFPSVMICQKAFRSPSGENGLRLADARLGGSRRPQVGRGAHVVFVAFGIRHSSKMVRILRLIRGCIFNL